MRFKKIYIEITNACNLSCSFCIKTKRKKEEMSVSSFKHIINEIKPFTNFIYLHIEGEPLLHSQLDEILKVCDDHDINVNITTNGTLLKQRLNILKKHSSIRQINISLHNENNDPNYFKNVFSSTEELKHIHISYRIWVQKQRDKIIDELVKQYGNIILKIFDFNNITIREHLYLNKKEEFIWPSLDNNYYNENGSCLGLKTHIGILVDGRVVVCCLDADGKTSLGNIFNESLIDILNKDRTKEIIDNFLANKSCLELCKHCSYKERLKCNVKFTKNN